MIKIKCGSRRVVFIYRKRYVVKIPKFWRWNSLLFGLCEQLNERYWYCPNGEVGEWENKYPLARIYWASRRGWIQVSKYYKPLSEYPDKREWDTERIMKDLEWHKGYGHYDDLLHGDGYAYNPDNVAWDEELGHYIAIDYGFSGMGNDYGKPVLKRHGRVTLGGHVNNMIFDFNKWWRNKWNRTKSE